MKHINRKYKNKSAEAKQRQEEYNKLTTAQKITKLNLKFEEGYGAIKERLKLSNLLLQEDHKKEIKDFQDLRQKVKEDGKIKKTLKFNKNYL